MFTRCQDFRFGEEPIVKVVVVLAVALHVDFKRKPADLFFKIWVRVGEDVSGCASDWLFRQCDLSFLGLEARAGWSQMLHLGMCPSIVVCALHSATGFIMQ